MIRWAFSELRMHRAIILLFYVLSFSWCWAQELPMDPLVRYGRLSNGLTYYVRSNAAPKGQIALGLFVRAGSLQEDEDQIGVAHVVEHMVFNDTRSFPRRMLPRWLKTVGVELGRHGNASTGYGATRYWLTAPAEDPTVVDSLVAALKDMAFHATFDATELQKEGSVILEEWRLGLDAEERMWRRSHNRVLYGDSRYAQRDPMGTEQGLQSLTREAVLRFYNEWYRPELMAVALVGDLPPETLEALVRRHFTETPLRQGREPKAYPIPKQPGFRISMAWDPETEKPYVKFVRFVPAQIVKTESDYRRRLVRQLAVGVLKERLLAHTYAADPPGASANCSYERFSPLNDLLLISMSYVPSKKVLAAVKALSYEIAKARLLGLTEAELERQKAELRRLIEEDVAERENTSSLIHLELLADHFIKEEPLLSPEEELKLLCRLMPTISCEEVKHALKELLAEENWAVLVSVLEKPGEPLPTAEEVQEAVEAGRNGALKAQLLEERLPPLWEGGPTVGWITKERVLPGLEATEWQLQNGARVVLYPTAIKNDDVLFRALSLGGHSLAPDSIFASARQAADLVEHCGAGLHGPHELTKVLAGRKVSLSPFLTESLEGFSGRAGSKELEVLFQLLYLHMTQPRLDSECVSSYRETQRAVLEGQEASPENVFLDKLKELYWQGHPRKRSLRERDIEVLQPEEAYNFYRERFGNVGDWVFILVGALDAKELRPLVERYIGSLPGKTHREFPKDTGARAASGVRVEFRKGVEAKSWIGIVYGGPFHWAVGNRFRLQAVERLLAMRLEDLLREELGRTYSVEVSAQWERVPVSDYSLSIHLACAPGQEGRVAKSILAEIEKLKGLGPTKEEVSRLKEVLGHDFELDQQRNGFWLELLVNHYLYGDSIEQMMDFSRWLYKLSKEDLRLAVKAFCRRPALQLWMLPEHHASEKQEPLIHP